MRAGSAPALCPGKAGRGWRAHAQKAAAGAGGRAEWVWEAGVSRQVERSGVAGLLRPGPARVGGRPAGQPVSGAWAGGEEGSEVKGQTCSSACRLGTVGRGRRGPGLPASELPLGRAPPSASRAPGGRSPEPGLRGAGPRCGGRRPSLPPLSRGAAVPRRPGGARVLVGPEGKRNRASLLSSANFHAKAWKDVPSAGILGPMN